MCRILNEYTSVKVFKTRRWNWKQEKQVETLGNIPMNLYEWMAEQGESVMVKSQNSHCSRHNVHIFVTVVKTKMILLRKKIRLIVITRHSNNSDRNYLITTDQIWFGNVNIKTKMRILVYVNVIKKRGS